jgi:hypothetical protein
LRFSISALREIEYDIDILDDQVIDVFLSRKSISAVRTIVETTREYGELDEDRRSECGSGTLFDGQGSYLDGIGRLFLLDGTSWVWGYPTLIQQALEYIAHCKQMTVPDLIIPSQARYASYFKNMLNGVRPSPPPLLLKRIIMSEAPKVSTSTCCDNINAT